MGFAEARGESRGPGPLTPDIGGVMMGTWHPLAAEAAPTTGCLAIVESTPSRRRPGS